jgi:hypothetical protein
MSPVIKLSGIFIKDRNFLLQNHVNEHLLLCKPPPCSTKKAGHEPAEPKLT